MLHSSNCRLLACLSLLFLSLAAQLGSAQSLDIKHPAVLKPGVTTGQIDALTGAHYYIFTAGPGQVNINITFKSVWPLGSMRTPLTVESWDIKRTQKSSFTLVSSGESVSHSFRGVLPAQGEHLLDIVPPRAIVRLGGQYEISLGGAVKDSETASSADPVTLHRYRWFVACPGDSQTCNNIRFNADGSFTVPGGDRGVWHVFDHERSIYTLVWNNSRKSVKYLPARGFVEINDPQVIVFQELP